MVTTKTATTTTDHYANNRRDVGQCAEPATISGSSDRFGLIELAKGEISKSITAASNIIHARIDGIEKIFENFQSDLTRVPTTMDRQILGLREKLEEKIGALEKDLGYAHKTLDSRGTEISAAIQHLRDLTFGKVEELSSVTTERFLGVAAQFSERDTRTDQRAGDTKLAVDAAFAAAKEATAKIEAGFTKQIDGMTNIIDTKTANLSAALGDLKDNMAGGLGDLKDRMTAMENRTVGISSAQHNLRDDRNDVRGLVFGIIGMVVGIGALFLTVMTHFLMVPK